MWLLSKDKSGIGNSRQEGGLINLGLNGGKRGARHTQIRQIGEGRGTRGFAFGGRAKPKRLVWGLVKQKKSNRL